MINPYFFRHSYPCEELNPWTKWQNDLSARIVIVGFYWGMARDYFKNEGKDNEDFSTNLTLIDLLSSFKKEARLEKPADWARYQEPRYKKPYLHFTNAIQCLLLYKPDEKAFGEIAQACVESFLSRLIEIIQPWAVITLGDVATASLAKVYGIPDKDHPLKRVKDVAGRDAEGYAGLRFEFKDTRGVFVHLFPVTHPGSRGSKSKSPSAQKRDWNRIAAFINSHPIG